MPTRPASSEPDPAAKLRERVVAALELLDGAVVAPHPAARAPSRRRANRLNYALMGARRELERLATLLDP
jgi:hypothetical protein